MNIYLSSINLFNIMCNYLKYQEITSLSLTNKYFYSVLNPEKNPYINTIYSNLLISNKHLNIFYNRYIFKKINSNNGFFYFFYIPPI